MTVSNKTRAVRGTPVVDPACWMGSDLAARTDWIFQMDSAEALDLKVMAASVGRRISGDLNGLLAMTKGDFDLGAFAPTLQRIKNELANGRGLALIRGLPLDGLTDLEAVAIYWGIGRHLGTACSNNAQGDMIGLVIDKGNNINGANYRGYETNAELMFHCDPGHIVGLLCLQTARSGGKSKVVSSVAVYNELLKRRPDLVDVLADPFCWSMHGEIEPGQKGYYEGPAFNFVEGYLCVVLAPLHMIKGHQVAGAPAMTPRQMEALTVAETVCEELHYAMELQRGDIQFLNNSVVLHARTSYEDWPDVKKRRCLLRLWLNEPNMRPLPYFQTQHRSGIRINGRQERINLGEGPCPTFG